MYGFSNNGAGVNRMPRSSSSSSSATTPSSTSTLGKTVGTTLIQAAALVVCIKVVDILVDAALSRFRKPRPEQPARNRREEHAVA
jgi:hypothetical protein